MSLPFSFSNNTSPTGGQLDSDLAAIAAMGIISCTATGTNAIVLTPAANQPTVAVYTDFMQFSFAAPAASTGNVTIQVGSLSPLPAFKGNGSQAGSGDVGSGLPYIIVYLGSLNAGAGGFMIINSLPSSAPVPFSLPTASGLLVKNDGSTPDTKIDITAHDAILTNSSGSPILVSSPNVVIDLTTVGANGMDAGSRPTSGWVYCYLISTGSAVAGLATVTSPTTGVPTMPGGYSYLMYVGAMNCDSSQNLRRTRQLGREIQYVVTASTNTAVLPEIANSSGGAVGTFNATTPIVLVAVTVVGNGFFVPLTAGGIKVVGYNRRSGSGPGDMIVAPSTSYGGTNQGPNGSTHNMFPLYDASNASPMITVALVLENTQIAWCTSGVSSTISCLGWTDYYVKA